MSRSKEQRLASRSPSDFELSIALEGGLRLLILHHLHFSA